MNEDSGDWARENFGDARVGDARRVARLVSMAEQAARRPSGKVTDVFPTSAERQGAFKLLENEAISASAVADATFAASARACTSGQRFYVAVDQYSLTFTDRAGRRDLGRVGTRWQTRGLQVMSALGVDEQGAAIGLLAQKWWARTAPARKKRGRNYGSKSLQLETRHWLDAISDVSERLAQHAEGATPWFQLDRGADCWHVELLAVEKQLLLTVRARYMRRRLQDERGRRVYLGATMKRQPLLGQYRVKVGARDGRRARVACMTLRARSVVIRARVASDKWRDIPMNAVLAEEVGHRGKDRLQWLLLTTAPVGTFEQAQAVVHGYTFRWRIEEFHRAWKRGHCHVEESQLQSRAALIKWATILAAVAARALRLAQLLRKSPDIPATDEFTKYEIAAVYALIRRRVPKEPLTLADVLNHVAELGGFANKYSGGRPGPTVLGRGLADVQITALALQNLAEMG
jgi:hypothetical protein